MVVGLSFTHYASHVIVASVSCLLRTPYLITWEASGMSFVHTCTHLCWTSSVRVLAATPGPQLILEQLGKQKSTWRHHTDGLSVACPLSPTQHSWGHKHHEWLWPTVSFQPHSRRRPAPRRNCTASRPGLGTNQMTQLFTASWISARPWSIIQHLPATTASQENQTRSPDIYRSWSS